MKYIGIDHHEQYSVVVVMDEKGTIINKGRFPMKRASIKEYMMGIKGVKMERKPKAVLEASYGWEFSYDVLSEMIDEVILAHPLKTRAIAEARIKHDLLDAQTFSSPSPCRSNTSSLCSFLGSSFYSESLAFSSFPYPVSR